MARKRLIAPEFFTHEGLAEAEFSSGLPIRLAFAGLWCQADRRGVFEWRPGRLKLAILPYDAAVDFGACLDVLVRAGFVERYEVEGREYGVIPSFGRWQTFHAKERESDHPGPTQHGARTVLGHVERGAHTVPGRVEHRARTVPGRVEHDGSLASTGTVSVTGAVSVTGTAAVVGKQASPRSAAGPVFNTDGSLRALPQPVLADERACRLLTAAVNRGVTAGRGEQPTPFSASARGAANLAHQLAEAGVTEDVAVAVLFRRARDHTGPLPRSIAYWAQAVVDAAAHRLASLDALALLMPTDADSEHGSTAHALVADETARRYAASGSVEWQAYCDEHGINWRATMEADDAEE